jgi:hypothetical protein
MRRMFWLLAVIAGLLIVGVPVSSAAEPIPEPVIDYECMGPGADTSQDYSTMCSGRGFPPCVWSNDGLIWEDEFSVWQCWCSIDLGCFWRLLYWKCDPGLASEARGSELAVLE